ncbi:MAG: hypothetical protein H0V73_00135 [Chloroflexi bacterium]|nr:hypothetical protein [Chloroflexota bacterium]
MDDLEGVRLGQGDAVLTFHLAEPGSRGDPIVTLDVSTLHASLPVDLDAFGGSLFDFFDSLAA